MRGRVLGFNMATGEGDIAGDDQQRYRFTRADWRDDLRPVPGQAVDFQTDGNHAISIYRVAGSAAMSGDKNKIVAALLAFFLGGLGIHKFYLGKNTAGIIMLCSTLFGIILLFVPTVIVAVIAFIEFIIYLVTPDDEFERRYVQGDRAWF